MNQNTISLSFHVSRKPSDILLVATWNAHSDCVTQLEYVYRACCEFS